jgi:hypothetical protein
MTEKNRLRLSLHGKHLILKAVRGRGRVWFGLVKVLWLADEVLEAVYPVVVEVDGESRDA